MQDQSRCLKEAWLSAVSSHAVQMLLSEILMWVLQPCQTHVLEVRLPNPHLGTHWVTLSCAKRQCFHLNCSNSCLYLVCLSVGLASVGPL